MKRRLEPVDFTANVPNTNVRIPQALSDEDKWMYLIHRAEIQTLLSLESEYEYHWKDHVHQMMTGCDPETLTREIENPLEHMKGIAIERLVKRKRYNEAFNVAIGEFGSVFFHFFMEYLSSDR